MSQGPSTSRNPGLLDFAAGPDGGPQGGRFQPICYERHPYNHLAPVSWDILGLRANQNWITI